MDDWEIKALLEGRNQESGDPLPLSKVAPRKTSGQDEVYQSNQGGKEGYDETEIKIGYFCACECLCASYTSLLTHIKYKHDLQALPGVTIVPLTNCEGLTPDTLNKIAWDEHLQTKMFWLSIRERKSKLASEMIPKAKDPKAVSEKKASLAIHDNSNGALQARSTAVTPSKLTKTTPVLVTQPTASTLAMIDLLQGKAERAKPANPQQSFVKQVNTLTLAKILDPIVLQIMAANSLQGGQNTGSQPNYTVEACIARYLNYLSQASSQKFIDLSVIVFRNLRNFLDCCGYTLLESLLKQIDRFLGRDPDRPSTVRAWGLKRGFAMYSTIVPEQSDRSTTNETFCNSEGPEYVCLTFEAFIQKWFMVRYPEFNIKYLLLLLQDFSSWLQKSELSVVTAEILSFVS